MEKNKQKSAVVAGHICLDIIPQIDHPFSLNPGRLYEVGCPTISTGGAVSNTGVALWLLDIPTTLMGKIGEDSFGHSILEVLGQKSSLLAAGMAVVPNVITSYTLVVNIPGSDRIFLHCPGANENFRAADIDYDKIANADLFHFGYPAFMASIYENDGEELLLINRSVKDKGVTTSLDLGMPEPEGPSGAADWRRILERTLPFVDIFMPSADELLYALDREEFGKGDNLTATDLNRLSAQLLDMGTAIVGIKLGSQGLYIRTGSAERLQQMGKALPANYELWANRELRLPILLEEKFVGATGAGDTTIAGFLAAFLRELSPENCARYATAVGACNVEAADALGGIMNWEQTTSRLNSGWQAAALTIEEAGWSQSPDGHCWYGPADAQKI